MKYKYNKAKKSHNNNDFLFLEIDSMVGVQPGTRGTSGYNTVGPADLRSISSEFTRN